MPQLRPPSRALQSRQYFTIQDHWLAMNMPNLLPKQSAAGEPTDLYQSSGATPGGPAGRIKVALVPGTGPQPTTDLQGLLHKRLRILTLIATVGMAAYLPFEFFRHDLTPELFWFVLLPMSVVWATPAAFAGVLWSRRRLSLGWLRTIELVYFGVVTVAFSWNQYNILRFWLPIYAERGSFDLAILATWTSTAWIMLIVTYGLFIPSTLRRSVALVGVMACMPLAIQAVVGLSDKAIEGRLLVHSMSLTGFLVMATAALAIFGAHRIEVLRQQAFEARKLGQYRLKERLGSGGMGEVYLAEPLLLRRPCAIKLIRPERAGDPNILRRFEREVQATATLTHPNTVQIFDYGHAEDGTFYYVMEYLPGLSLEEFVKQHGPLPPERAVHFLRQVCGALREAHAIGLIHRDIKPSNVLICERGGLHDVAKLLDFGLVQAPDASADSANLTQEGAVAGTPAYMSPEQAGGQENLDPRSDIYSLGAVAYFLLTGQPPFAGKSPAKMVAAHIYEPPAPLSKNRPDVCEDLQAVVLRCLAKVPADRFPDAESLEIALTGCATTCPWCEKQAANWWRSLPSASDAVAYDKGAGELSLTRR
jgi:eukaryotic-like serine/threonine-protein kinase